MLRKLGVLAGVLARVLRGGLSLDRNEEQHPRQHSRQHPEFSQHSHEAGSPPKIAPTNFAHKFFNLEFDGTFVETTKLS